jgi:hypothetical protein
MHRAPPEFRSHGFCDARLYNDERPHQALRYHAPRQIVCGTLQPTILARGGKRWHEIGCPGYDLMRPLQIMQFPDSGRSRRLGCLAIVRLLDNSLASVDLSGEDR